MSRPRLHPVLGLGVATLLQAQGWDGTLGIAMQRRDSAAFGPATVGGSNQTPVVLRGAWDRDSWLSRRGRILEQWSAAVFSARSTECDEQALSLGYQRAFWSQEAGKGHAGIGADLRIARRTGKDFEAWYQVAATNPWDPPGSHYGQSTLVPLGGTTVWEARPVLRLFAGFRGVLLPFVGSPVSWGRPSDPLHSITRFELALPVGKPGGSGEAGLLRRLAPGPEFTVSFGFRFQPPS